MNLDALDDETLDKALWLQEHIRETGIPAIGFMKAAKQEAESNAGDTVADHIDRSMKT